MNKVDGKQKNMRLFEFKIEYIIKLVQTLNFL